MNALNQVPGRTQQRGRSQYPADSNTRSSALAGIYREGCSDALERSRVVWSGSPTKPAKQFGCPSREYSWGSGHLSE